MDLLATWQIRRICMHANCSIGCIAAASVQQLCRNKLCFMHLYLQSLLCLKAAAISIEVIADAGHLHAESVFSIYSLQLFSQPAVPLDLCSRVAEPALST
jgi:hypothetical protein